MSKAALGVAIVALAASAVLVGSAMAKPAGPGPGNSPNAKQCQKGGWEDLVRSDGSGFASEQECTSYAAQGGTLAPKPVATAQSICEDAGGTFQTGGTRPGPFPTPVLWACNAPSGTLDADEFASLQAQCFADGGTGFGSTNLSHLPPGTEQLHCLA